MSEKNSQVKVQKPILISFMYRNVKKDFQKFKVQSYITKQAHLEIDSDNKTKIVQDRDRDWFELANMDADKVGLANILELARKRGADLNQFAFKDEEAVSLSGLDPNNPQAMQKALNSDASYKKLEAISKKLGISVGDLVKAVADGTLSSIIEAKTAEKEVKDNAEKQSNS